MNFNDFPFGYRRTTTYNDHAGEPYFTYMALTQKDFLNPQEDDHFPLGKGHDRTVSELFRIFQHTLHHRPQFSVYRSLKMLWGIDGLDQPIPDIAIMRNVYEPQRHRTVFDVMQEKVTPCIIIEVTSPLFAQQDLEDKVEIYAQAGIAEYLVIDDAALPGQSNAKSDRKIVGYRLLNDRYEPLEPDERGFLYSQHGNFWIGCSQEGDRIIVLDESGAQIEPVDIAAEAKIAELQGERRGNEIMSALDFLNKGVFDA